MNISGSPGVDLDPRKDGEPGGNDEFPLYRSLVGSLMWLSVMTRPDIIDALRACARHSHNPNLRHWKALLQIAVYENSTFEIGLRFANGSGLKLYVFDDVGHAAASNDRRSVCGEPVMLGDTAIGWKSSTQKCVMTATCEAKYVALCDAFKEALFMRTVLVFLQPDGMRVVCSATIKARKRSRTTQVARLGVSIYRREAPFYSRINSRGEVRV